MPAETILKWRRGTAAEWESADPILAAGEPGYETDTEKFKIGDGTTSWLSLGYQNISGPAGADGADGADGATGATGATGETGATGPTGADGSPGQVVSSAVYPNYEIYLTTGPMSFIPDSYTGYGVGTRLRFVDISSYPYTNWMEGVVTLVGTTTAPPGATYSPQQVDVNIDTVNGSGGSYQWLVYITSGQTGATGPTGADSTVAGPTGPTGPTGATGADGLDGDQGIQGEQGIQGVQGIQGNTGPQGEVGPTGPQGDTGPTGADGANTAATPTTIGSVYGDTAYGEEINLSIGKNSLASVTTGWGNTAIGQEAMDSVTSASGNTAVGARALSDLTTGTGANTAIGTDSLRFNRGASNTAVGNASQLSSGDGLGSNNTSVGAYTLKEITNGGANVAIGSLSQEFNSTGGGNVSLGWSALRLNQSGEYNVAIGYRAGESELGSNKLYIANSSTTTPLIYGDFSESTLVINGALTVDSLTVGNVSNTEFGYLAGVTSNIQDQINSAGQITSESITSNTQISVPGRYFVDTTSALTVTLPASPTMGDEIQIFDVTGSAETYNITVENNGNNINGLLDSALLDVNYVVATFTYTNSTTGWRMR